MADDSVLYELQDGVAIVTLNRPDNANCLSQGIPEGLKQKVQKVQTDKDVRAMILTGTGKFFCAGGDLGEFSALGENLSDHMYEKVSSFHNLLSLFSRLEKPVIIAVNGIAAGGGLSLSLMGDYIIASDTAKFTLAYTNGGLSPDGGSTYYLAKHIGLLRAKEMLITNRVLSADEAMTWGMVSEVVNQEKVMARALEVALPLAKGPTRAFGAVKKLLMTAYSENLESQLALETLEMVKATSTQDAKAGINAFLNKQKPEFSGE